MSESYYLEVIRGGLFGWEFTDRSKQGLDHFQFEEVDPFFWYKLGTTLPYMGFFGAGAYILLIFSLRRWMEGRPAFKLNGFLIYWNIFLGVFSLLGFVRIFPGFLRLVRRPGGIYESICVRKGAEAQWGMWLVCFVLSKFLQCGDTILLVLRKRPLVFTHLTHHLMIMILCWTLGPYLEPVGRWLLVLNYAEHAMMYPYFTLRALGIKTPNFIPNFITTFQFLLTVLMGVMGLASTYYYQAGYDCFRDPFSIRMTYFASVFFIAIFAKLFYDLVWMEGRQKKEASRLKTDNSNGEKKLH